MQRVRIGITGLAVVFLVVLLAAAIVGFQSQDEADEASVTPNNASIGKSSPSDPLADLGVAPGGSESGATRPDEPKP